MRNYVLVEPSVEPLTLEQVKQHLRVSTTDQDTLINGLIKAAREYVEGFCGKSLITQTRVQTQDAFYEVWADSNSTLRYGPVQEITEIRYIDSNGVTQVVDPSIYKANLASDPPYFYNAYGEHWPVPRYEREAVVIEYIAGYPGSGSPLDLRARVPEMIKTAMKMLIGHWYDNSREASTPVNLAIVPIGVDTLLTPYRSHLF